MRAARQFAERLEKEGKLERVETLNIELYGSLAMTGVGHKTPEAILLGLEGERPEGVDPEAVESRVARIRQEKRLLLLGTDPIDFSPNDDLVFHRGKRLPFHSNAIRFRAFDRIGRELSNRIYYSVGGGFVVPHEEIHAPREETVAGVPYPFKTAEELLGHCRSTGRMVYDVVMENEMTFRSAAEVRRGILQIWQVMHQSIERGIRQEGVLPGGLEVKRRAASLYQQLAASPTFDTDPAEFMDWVSLFALAVNEENAAGGRIVTAPTNGAAGVVPAVIQYYLRFTDDPSHEGIVRFFLTAAAIGALYKEGASLSAAEMGCQGEIGVACSMAAGALVAALGGTNEQIEQAAEIGMEHNLGLTCDPVGGLVQIPCIERNTMGAIKAINAARLALRGDGTHRVSLDEVISAMRQTGEDMKHTYKETSEAGLALHVSVGVPAC
jgi:L-serine dehydratase